MISLRGPKLKILAGLIAAVCLIAGVYFTFFQACYSFIYFFQSLIIRSSKILSFCYISNIF